MKGDSLLENSLAICALTRVIEPLRNAFACTAVRLYRFSTARGFLRYRATSAGLLCIASTSSVKPSLFLGVFVLRFRAMIGPFPFNDWPAETRIADPVQFDQLAVTHPHGIIVDAELLF